MLAEALAPSDRKHRVAINLIVLVIALMVGLYYVAKVVKKYRNGERNTRKLRVGAFSPIATSGNRRRWTNGRWHLGARFMADGIDTIIPIFV